MKKILLLVIVLRFVTANAQTTHALIPPPVPISSTGTPGPATKIIIRCLGTITTENKPLIVVDGIPLEDDELKKINPSDILTIDILKDVAASALYGIRAAYGVIIITTKAANEKTFFVLDDDDKAPLEGATVKIISAKNSNDTVTVIAGKNGEVTTLLRKSKFDFDLLVTSVGYETLQTKIQFRKSKLQPQLLLKRKVATMDAVRISTFTTSQRRWCGGCRLRGIKTYSYQDSGVAKISSNDFTVYPNPAKANTSITVQTNKSFQGLLQLLNTTGQVVQQKRINSKANTVSFPLPFAGAGIYFIQLTDEQTGKSSTQKLMVQ